MKALKRLASNIQNLDTKVLFKFVFSQTETQDLIIDLNRIGQLFNQGIDADGKIIGLYSAFTEELTQGVPFGFGGGSGTKRKKAGEPIFLLDEGDFYRSFKVKVLADGFVIQADTLKDGGDDLTDTYGKQILGLTQNSKVEIVKEILPMAKEFILSQIRK